MQPGKQKIFCVGAFITMILMSVMQDSCKLGKISFCSAKKNSPYHCIMLISILWCCLQEQFNSQLREVTEEKIKETRDVRHNQAVHHDRNVHTQSQKVTDEKIREMKDQLIRAKAYLNFAPPGSNSHLVKELRLRIKEVERAVGEHTKDSDLSRRYVSFLYYLPLYLLPDYSEQK